MTGYASAEDVVLERAFRVEARSLNSRYLEVRLRVPDMLAAIEPEVISLVREYVSRGRVEVSASLETRDGDLQFIWNRDRARAYVRLFNEMKKDLKVFGKIDLSLLLSQKDVIILGNSGALGKEMWPEIRPVFKQCFEELRRMREDEGSWLAKDLTARMITIKDLTDEIGQRSSGLVEEYTLPPHDRITGRGCHD
jgi:uncharacterized protein (TIGR00255 family)